MRDTNGLKARIQAAAGASKPQLVLKNAKVLNVFTNELEHADVAVTDGYIVGVGEYEGVEEKDLSGCVICPGFIDGHIHLESSMIPPSEFEKAVVPHGTTTVVTDPHEIANVAGTQGIEYMLAATEKLKLSVYFMLPSCVPSTELDESGAVLLAEQLRPYYNEERVLGLAELMNSFGTVQADPDILDKLYDVENFGKLTDGHAPGLNGKELNAYVTAGVMSDHECSDASEAVEKLRRGQWIMIREGTAAKNLEALMPLFNDPYYQRCMLATDDKHPGDLIQGGHIDYIIRKAVKLGADPVKAVRMGTLHAAQYFGLKKLGAVAPGYQADLTVLSDLEQVQVKCVYKKGKLVADNGKFLGESEDSPKVFREVHDRVLHSFQLDEVKESDFQLKEHGSLQRVFTLVPGEILTTEQIVPWKEMEGVAPGVDLEHDIVKMAVLERHLHTGHIGIGFIGGYGLKKGAVATSVAHDSHNLLVAGTNDRDMVIAANAVRANEGGLAIAADGKLIGELKLPIAGLMSLDSAEEVEEKLEELKACARDLGIPETIDPFMTLAFTSLPVIPKLRLNTYGLIDTDMQKVVPVLWNPSED
ncbi:adenine deaminase [Clostridium sp. chh4-2]|uniref:adenine deaminase n=1 Tax=Clostridium sp. chh4-2 TaxID=2067550 RepID=UPI000CCF83C0|nr:adenine deaminase [Clostridium sp. chh4-2]PNV59351.1 adenine deaminase [Clostridium sp. chh4-2]